MKTIETPCFIKTSAGSVQGTYNELSNIRESIRTTRQRLSEAPAGSQEETRLRSYLKELTARLDRLDRKMDQVHRNTTILEPERSRL